MNDINIQMNNDGGKPSAPPPYSFDHAKTFSTDEQQKSTSREEKLRDIIEKYEISPFFADKLQSLLEFKVVFIFDDSGSMNTLLSDSPLNTGLFKARRWDELKQFAKMAIEIANVFSADGGSDVRFLNRPGEKSVTHVEQLDLLFEKRPAGFTPISDALDSVLSSNSEHYLAESKLLVLIVTDGEPTDKQGRVGIADFKRSLKDRHNNVFTTIVACTDDDETMSYLDNWDTALPRLDVVDDFRNERSQIQQVQGRGFRFSFGDYVVKSLVGSIHASLDALDEKKEGDNPCCLIL